MKKVTTVLISLITTIVLICPLSANLVQGATLTGAAALRTGLINRETSITITRTSKETVDSLLDEALQYTNKGNEGDYLKYNIAGYSYRTVGNKIIFSFDYNDDASQEKIVTTNIDSKKYSGTDIQKIQSIYNYVVIHAKYADNSEKDQYFTAYGHYLGAAYCQGYALTLYRMMNNNGIPCRIIVGTAVNTSGKAESHAWNTIKYNNKWYYMDATWDSCLKNTSTNTYAYFMKSPSDFNTDHTPEDTLGLDFADSSYGVKYYTVSISGGSGSGTYASGSVVTVKAAAPDGYTFSKWTGSATFVSGNMKTATVKIRVKGNVSLKANFTENVAKISNGNYKITSKNTGSKVLTIKANSKKNNANVVGGKRTAATATFTATKTGDYYYFKNKSSKKFLDLKGNQVIQGSKNSTSKWKIIKAGSGVYKLKNQNGKIITLNGSKVTGGAAKSGTVQKFVFKK